MFDFEEIPIYWVNRLAFSARKELSARFREAGFDVTPKEWAVLLILWRRPDQTPGSIADATVRDRTTVSRLVDGMVRKGLVERRADPADRRRSVLRATARGHALKEHLVPIAKGLVAQAQRGIDPEHIQITLKTLRRMTQNTLPSPD
ncbi:MAG: MarR family winged helix-turn-helix transcriptional regulator [Myxococcales bacterium]|nr:MarR family winged helix-turn-helix transcriptional regulator [Myxococcales bacterium]